MTTSIGILSWKAHETLTKTLKSYADVGIRDFFGEAVIHFNSRTDADDSLAQRFGWIPAGNETNFGLLDGTEKLAREMSGEILLMLQNDCPICVSREDVKNYLAEAIALIENDKADIVRCRHRWNAGQGFSDRTNYLKCYHPGGKKTIYGMLRPFKAKKMIGRSPYVENHPETIFPRYIKREGDFLIVDSSVINFTDQPFIIRKDLLLRLCRYAKSHPKKRTLNGFQVLELNLNCRWWRKQHLRIAVGEGCFTHNRFDDSFRTNHAAFNRQIVG